MNLFSHFENGIFVGESTYRSPEFWAGEFEDIFDDSGKIVVSLSKDQILEALQDGECLSGLTENEVNRTYESIISQVEIEY